MPGRSLLRALKNDPSSQRKPRLAAAMFLRRVTRKLAPGRSQSSCWATSVPNTIVCVPLYIQTLYESIDKPIDEALKAEVYWLYQAISSTPAIKRFTIDSL